MIYTKQYHRTKMSVLIEMIGIRNQIWYCYCIEACCYYYINYCLRIKKRRGSKTLHNATVTTCKSRIFLHSITGNHYSFLLFPKKLCGLPLQPVGNLIHSNLIYHSSNLHDTFVPWSIQQEAKTTVQECSRTYVQ